MNTEQNSALNCNTIKLLPISVGDNPSSKIHLLIALRRIILEDNSSARAKDFQDVMKVNRLIKWVYQIYSLLRPGILTSFAVALFGVKYFLGMLVKEKRIGQFLFTYAYNNEKAVGDYVTECTEPDQVVIVEQGAALIFKPENLKILWQSLQLLRSIKTYFRIIRRLNRKYDFMPACRTASTLCYYTRFKQELQRNNFSAVLVAKNYSPDCIALVWAAKSLKIPSIYCSHTFAPPLDVAKPPLSFSLSLLQGPAMHQIFSERAPIYGAVAYKGIAGNSVPIKLEALKNHGMKIGIFLSGATNVAGVEKQIEDLIRDFAPVQILIRLHPNSLVNANINHLTKKYNFIKLTFGTPLNEDLCQVDFIVVGNSGVLLEVLKAGVPCVYVSTLENLDFDYNGFVAAKIVPYWKSGSKLTVSEIIDFYNLGWLEAFRRYDPYYLLEQNPKEVVRKEIAKLFNC